VTRELAAARLQSDVVAAVSHEFRTPLTTLRQLTEALTDDRLPSESRRHTYYAALARQTDRLRRLVESLLDFGRLEAGSSPYRMVPLDAMPFVRGVTAEFAAESAARGVDVDIQTSGADALVLADREALANALWNLLDNAVKYSPDCRTIAVVVECESNRVAIRVRDRGFGIPPGEQRQIFGRFVRGSRAKADGIKGTGIGLSIVQHVVAAHGGDVQVQSEPGTGTTFTIWLPMAPVAREKQNSVSWQESS
jgi:two-component system phosphate regulon sensor histidine kinase PhoR